MVKRVGVVLSVILLMGLSDLFGEINITSFGSDGQLTWTDSEVSGTEQYAVRWAGSLTNDWKCYWDDIKSSAGTTTTVVPRMYSVIKIPTDKLVAHYRFVYDCRDYTTNKCDGTPVGAAMMVQGRNDDEACVMFNSAESYVNCGSDSVLELADGNMTFSFWVNLGTTNSSSYVLGKMDYSSQHGYHIAYSSSYKSMVMYVNNSFACRALSDSFSPHKWYHVAFTRNGTSRIIEMYINGEIIKDTSASTTWFNPSTYSLLLGHKTSTSSTQGMTGGRLKNVRIYNKELSADEIKSIYQFEYRD